MGRLHWVLLGSLLLRQLTAAAARGLATRKWRLSFLTDLLKPEAPDISKANLQARDLPYDLVSPDVFEVYKAFGRLADPFEPHGSLPPSRRLFMDRLFKGFTRLEGITEDQFRIRLEYDWRFVLPLAKDPLAPPQTPEAPGGSKAPEAAEAVSDGKTPEDQVTMDTAASSPSPFEALDLKLCQAWAAARGLPLVEEEATRKQRQQTRAMRLKTAFLWAYSRLSPPHLGPQGTPEALKALTPPEPLPPRQVLMQEARRRISAEINQQGLHPAILEALWHFFAQGNAILTKDQAAERMDFLIGGPSGGPRLWLDASEVPGLLGGGQKGAQKSEALHVKHLFFRGGRLLYRNPAAVSAPGRKPNPRGLPPRLSVERFWGCLGQQVNRRMQNFDWEALEAREAQIEEERTMFLSCIRKTIQLRQQRRRFCMASRRLLDGIWLSVLHSRNTNKAHQEALTNEALLLKVKKKREH
ncbi:hypothetical protein cyc_06625 [Cyclospora cayetanensis]|uniref:Uncharacterized protein n=1 Tax=Cyclospora cayetanensis TaxID=88456 RepID=A0A1D3CSE5_9EIME|nr:hypothetical protein cyc_06625 [Cyclospora cayetanensis]